MPWVCTPCLAKLPNQEVKCISCIDRLTCQMCGDSPETPEGFPDLHGVTTTGNMAHFAQTELDRKLVHWHESSAQAMRMSEAEMENLHGKEWDADKSLMDDWSERFDRILNQEMKKYGPVSQS